MWFKIDDKFHDHPKVRDPDLEAIGLWVLSGSWSGEKLTDGFVPESVARRWTTPARLRKLSSWLVDRGLWEPAERGREVGWTFHDWADMNPLEDETTSDLGRMRWRRKNALSKDKQLREKVVARDHGCCRYCGIKVNWSNRNGDKGGTYDHVDPLCFEPHGGNFYDPDGWTGVVVACRRCNGRKRDRTPEEAHMPLLPVPDRYAKQAPELAPSQNGASTEQAPPTRDGAESSRTRLGVGSTPAPEPAPGTVPGRPDPARSPLALVPVSNGHALAVPPLTDLDDPGDDAA